jgi:hypothetical protein
MRERNETWLLPWGELEVARGRCGYWVVRSEDPSDWLVMFERNSQFPALAWAENMVMLYNMRLERPDFVPPLPPGQRPRSFHPRR